MLPRVGQIGEHKFLLQAGGSILMSNDGSISVSVKGWRLNLSIARFSASTTATSLFQKSSIHSPPAVHALDSGTIQNTIEQKYQFYSYFLGRKL